MIFLESRPKSFPSTFRFVTSVKFINVLLISIYLFVVDGRKKREREKRKKKENTRTVRNIPSFRNWDHVCISAGEHYWRAKLSSPFRCFPFPLSRYYTLSRVNKFTSATAIAHGTAYFNIEPAWTRCRNAKMKRGG